MGVGIISLIILRTCEHLIAQEFLNNLIRSGPTLLNTYSHVTLFATSVVLEALALAACVVDVRLVYVHWYDNNITVIHWLGSLAQGSCRVLKTQTQT